MTKSERRKKAALAKNGENYIKQNHHRIVQQKKVIG